MPTSKPRFMVTVSDDMYRQIENYRFQNRCKSQTQAINELITRGIDAILTDAQPVEAEKNPVIPDGISEDEKKFLIGFASLTPANRRLLLGFVQLLLKEQG